MKNVMILSLLALAGSASAQPGLVISGFLANPASNDANFEYAQIVATQSINFATTPYTVVFANNGAATSNGWAAGAALSYALTITTGTVNVGDVFYVGGNGQLINGTGSTSLSSLTWLRTFTTTSTGDAFANALFGNAGGTAGVVGNGGTNADGIAIFNLAASSITNTSTPIDAVFYGSGLGTAVVSGGTAGYRLPANDFFSGGFLGSAGNTALLADPASGAYTRLTGTFDTTSNTWTTARVGSQVALTTTSPASAISSAITIVPTPGSVALAAMGGLLAARRRR